MLIKYKNHFGLIFLNTFNYFYYYRFQIYALYMDIIILKFCKIENVIAQPTTLSF